MGGQEKILLGDVRGGLLKADYLKRLDFELGIAAASLDVENKTYIQAAPSGWCLWQLAAQLRQLGQQWSIVN